MQTMPSRDLICIYVLRQFARSSKKNYQEVFLSFLLPVSGLFVSMTVVLLPLSTKGLGGRAGGTGLLDDGDADPAVLLRRISRAFPILLMVLLLLF